MLQLSYLRQQTFTLFASAVKNTADGYFWIEVETILVAGAICGYVATAPKPNDSTLERIVNRFAMPGEPGPFVNSYAMINVLNLY